METLLRKKLVYWLPILLFVPAFAWFIVSAYFGLRHPPVGTFIAMLGFAAGIVTIWPPENRLMKAVCILLFTCLTALEVSTLYRQRHEDEAAAAQNRIDEDNRFADILRDQHNQFSQVLEQNRQEFSASLGRMDTTLNTITGGDSYLYFEPQVLGDRPTEVDFPNAPKGSILFNAYPKFVGSYPLHDVVVTISGGIRRMHSIEYQSIFPGELGKPKPFISEAFSALQSNALIFIMISASNGSYSQIVLVKKIKGHWVWASTFAKYGRKKPKVRTWSSSDFPKELLHVDWNQFNS